MRRGTEPTALRGRRTGQLDLTPPALRDIAKRIGERRARRVWRLMQRGIVATLPEYLTIDWLERRPWLRYHFQSEQMGGWLVAGGAVVDFLVGGLSAEGWYVWRIQGEYWHASTQAKDDAQRHRLLQLRIAGVPVVAVVDLWERDIYDRSPEVFEMAEMGIGLRG